MPYAATCHPERAHYSRGFCRQCYNRDYNARKVDQLTAKREEHYLANKEAMDVANKAWRMANRARVRHNKAKRRAARKNATPTWLTAEHWMAIDAYYREALLRSSVEGITYEVDHIVPLRGKRVCGLHVPWNLQVITATENRKKRNKELKE